ncbi:MAG TPA: hypothetical protein VFI63_02150 [Solirubrobacterales bacterium]|nr:hypothetical protein [Solirubrobacterales bacterium]
MRRMGSIAAAALLTAAALGHGVLSAAPQHAAAPGRTAALAGDRTAALAGDRTAALAAFETVRSVLQHPRCQNCHIPGDAPLQLDEGVNHTENVQRGPAGLGVPGLPCSTCHASANSPASYGAHMPPGAPGWRLPPRSRKMVFIGLSPADLCATVKDPKRNGGRSLAALREHLAHDKLVLWGWSPGVGRAPVAVPHDDLVAAVDTWIAAGAPCPPAAEAAKPAAR